MEWWQVYLWVKLDSIVSLVGKAGFFFGLSTVIAFISAGLATDNKDETWAKRFIILMGLTLCLTAASCTSSHLIPTTKEAALIYGVNAVTNSERVSRNVDATLDNAERIGGMIANVLEHKLNEMGQ